MKIGITKPVEVEAKTLKLYCKVCDNFTASLHDQDDIKIHTQPDGYVPDFMPGQHYGDYLILNIDIDTGQVINWKTPSAEDLQTWVSQHGDDD